MACNACGDKWYNTTDSKFYDESDCVVFADDGGACRAQALRPCVCSGCSHVLISNSFPLNGNWNCSTDSDICTDNCTSVPELSGPSILAPLVAIAFFLFFNRKAKTKKIAISPAAPKETDIFKK